MNLIPFDKAHKPPLGTKALILAQRLNDHGVYWHSWDVAVYVKSPYDRRKHVWCSCLHIRAGDNNPWVFTDVTHYMLLEEALGDYLPPEDVILPGVTYGQLGDANVRNSELIFKFLEKQ